MTDERVVYAVSKGSYSDDERDLAQALFRTLYDAGVSFQSGDLIPRLTATVRAAGFRRQGPITDEWEYAVAEVLSGELYVYDMKECFTEAEARAQRVEDDDIIVRRRKAGPWEPVPSTTEQEGDRG